MIMRSHFSEYVLCITNELELDLKMGREVSSFQMVCVMYRLQWNLGREDVDNEYTSIMDNGGMYRLHYPN